MTAYVRTMRLLDSVADLCAEEVRLAGLDAQVGIVDAPSAPEALQRVIDALDEAERLR